MNLEDLEACIIWLCIALILLRLQFKVERFIKYGLRILDSRGLYLQFVGLATGKMVLEGAMEGMSNKVN